MLKEAARHYYEDLGRSCSEALLLAAGETYGLNVTEEEANLFTAFRAGMGCGSLCGALAGSVAAISRYYKGRDDLPQIAAAYVAFFSEKMGMHSTLCSEISPKYKTPQRRCSAAVELAADTLVEFLRQREG